MLVSHCASHEWVCVSHRWASRSTSSPSLIASSSASTSTGGSSWTRYTSSTTTSRRAVVTLTDRKPPFLFQTAEKVMQLKDKHTKPFFVPATEFKDEELKLMHQWVSRTWN